MIFSNHFYKKKFFLHLLNWRHNIKYYNLRKNSSYGILNAMVYLSTLENIKKMSKLEKGYRILINFDCDSASSARWLPYQRDTLTATPTHWKTGHSLQLSISKRCNTVIRQSSIVLNVNIMIDIWNNIRCSLRK